MEEEKAAAYYDELTRKGGGAARFKQGLGFGSDSNSHHQKSSSSSSCSFLSNFVRASQSQSQSIKDKGIDLDVDIERHSQLETVRNKLTKKPRDPQSNSIHDVDNTNRPRVRDTRNRTETHKHRSPEKSRRHRSPERDRDTSRRRHRSPTKESSRSRKSRRSRSRSRERERERKSKCNDLMTPAERLKASIRLELSNAAHNDTNMGVGSTWQRFHFDKDAPLDDAHDLSVPADDDAALVNQFGKTFRFTSFEAKREDQIKNAHDQAMFGVPAPNPSYASETEQTNTHNFHNTHANHHDTPTSLLNEQVLCKQQGSWRDRARRNLA